MDFEFKVKFDTTDDKATVYIEYNEYGYYTSYNGERCSTDYGPYKTLRKACDVATRIVDFGIDDLDGVDKQ